MTLPRFIQRIAPRYSRGLQTPLGQRLLRGAFWSVAGVVISRGLTLLASMLVARVLGVTRFGELGIIQATTGLFQTFAGFALGVTATKYVAENRFHDPERTGRVIGLGISVSIVTGLCAMALLYVCAPWLSIHALADGRLEPLLRISSVILILSAVNGAQTGALSGFESFRAIAIVNLVSGLISFPVLLSGVLLHGLKGCVWSLAITTALNGILSQIALRSEMKRAGVPLRMRSAWNEIIILFKFTLPALIGGVVVLPVTWLCNVLLVKRGGGYAEMGLLNAANLWFTAVVFLPGMIGQVLLPIFSERIAQDTGDSTARLMRASIEVNVMVTVPFVLVASAASPLIMRFYGQGYEQGWRTLVAVLCTAGFIAVQTPVSQVIAASGKMWMGLIMNVGWAIVCLGTTIVTVKWGAFGVSAARLLAYGIHTGWTLAFAVHFMRTSRPVQSTGPSLPSISPANL
jgi:O-antigen/teichoic acid export membrane protein